MVTSATTPAILAAHLPAFAGSWRSTRSWSPPIQQTCRHTEISGIRFRDLATFLSNGASTRKHCFITAAQRSLYERGYGQSGNRDGFFSLARSHAGVAQAHANLGTRSAALDAIRRAEIRLAEAPDNPANSAQRGGRAQVYEYLAETYVALATRPGRASADARADWSAACDMFRRSHDVWEDMRRRGILSVTDASKPGEVAREIARCEQILVKSTRPKPGRRESRR